MVDRLFTAAAVAAALAGAALMPAALAAQASKASPAKAAAIPRTADGKPDLSGMYDVATLTPVERAAGTPLVLTDDQAAELEQKIAATKDERAAPIKGDRDAPPVGGDGSVGAAGNVGGYNSFWIDSGSRYSVIDGRKRASIVIDPPDGRVPQMNPEA